VVSLDSTDERSPPATYRFDVEGNHGEIVHPLPVDSGDYSIYASAATEEGLASKTVSQPVTGEGR
jgi:hypothetical protein